MEPTPWDPEGVEVALDPDGALVDDVSVADEDLLGLYEALVAARSFDVRLARVGLPTWASAAGEEAPLVLIGQLARDGDWIYPGFRDAAVAASRGMDYQDIARQLVGRDADTEARAISSREHGIAPHSEALGVHLMLAAGHAHAEKLDESDRIVAAICGEGTTTTGFFHEALALSVACELPLVFVCKTQLWPNGAPVEAGVMGTSVCDRAHASGLWARRVDGADVVAVRGALSAAYAYARDDRGPALVEAVVTQLQHDPPAHRDPIERLRRHLDSRGIWKQSLQDRFEHSIKERLDQAFAFLEETDA